MAINDKLHAYLNDLIKINNDRIKGYEKASKEAQDIDVELLALFEKMKVQSRNYVQELSGVITKLGGDVTTDNTAAGKIYHAWMDVKATFSGHDRKAILSACEFGEDAAQKAYEGVLVSDAPITEDIRTILVDQKHALEKSHNMIREYRDLYDKL